jgi:hypothetical protein
MKLERNVNVVYTNLSRNEWHLKASGREKLALLIGQNIKAHMVKYKDTPIMLKWIESQVESNHKEIRKKFVDGENSVIINKEVRSSKRQKKNPVSKNKDFFMDDELSDNVIPLQNRKSIWKV